MPFEDILSHALPEFSLKNLARHKVAPSENNIEDYDYRLDLALQKEIISLCRAKDRYKRSFDARLRKRHILNVGEASFLDMSDPA